MAGRQSRQTPSFSRRHSLSTITNGTRCSRALSRIVPGSVTGHGLILPDPVTIRNDRLREAVFPRLSELGDAGTAF